MMITEERDKKTDRQMEKLKTKLKEGKPEELEGPNVFKEGCKQIVLNRSKS